MEQVLGFGDPIKAFSMVLSNSSEKLASVIPNGSANSTSLFRGNQTGVHLIKAFGPDTSIRTDIENLIRWDSDSFYYDPAQPLCGCRPAISPQRQPRTLVPDPPPHRWHRQR